MESAEHVCHAISAPPGGSVAATTVKNGAEESHRRVRHTQPSRVRHSRYDTAGTAQARERRRSCAGHLSWLSVVESSGMESRRCDRFNPRTGRYPLESVSMALKMASSSERLRFRGAKKPGAARARVRLKNVLPLLAAVAKPDAYQAASGDVHASQRVVKLDCGAMVGPALVTSREWLARACSPIVPACRMGVMADVPVRPAHGRAVES